VWLDVFQNKRIKRSRNADTAAQKPAVIQKTSTAIYKGELTEAEPVRQRVYAAAERKTGPALKAQTTATADTAYNKTQLPSPRLRRFMRRRRLGPEHEKAVADAAKAHARTMTALRENDVEAT